MKRLILAAVLLVGVLPTIGAQADFDCGPDPANPYNPAPIVFFYGVDASGTLGWTGHNAEYSSTCLSEGIDQTVTEVQERTDPVIALVLRKAGCVGRAGGDPTPQIGGVNDPRPVGYIAVNPTVNFITSNVNC